MHQTVTCSAEQVGGNVTAWNPPSSLMVCLTIHIEDAAGMYSDKLPASSHVKIRLLLV